MKRVCDDVVNWPAQPTNPKNRKQPTEFRVDNLRIGWSYALRIGWSYRQTVRIGLSYFDPLLKHLPWTKKALENCGSIFPKMQLAILENHTCAFRKTKTLAGLVPTLPVVVRMRDCESPGGSAGRELCAYLPL